MAAAHAGKAQQRGAFAERNATILANLESEAQALDLAAL